MGKQAEPTGKPTTGKNNQPNRFKSSGNERDKGFKKNKFDKKASTSADKPGFKKNKFDKTKKPPMGGGFKKSGKNFSNEKRVKKPRHKPRHVSTNTNQNLKLKI